MMRRRRGRCSHQAPNARAPFDASPPLRYKLALLEIAEKNLPKVTFLNEQITASAEPGQTLLEVAEKHGINLFRGIFQELHCNRVSGWCNRCKVWASATAPGAINPRTAKENMPLRINGALPKEGNMRLACQVIVSGDCEVRTRSGFVQSESLEWAPDPRHFKWRDRWDRRNDEPDEDEKPKKAPVAKPVAAKTAAAPNPVVPEVAAAGAAPDAQAAPASPPSAIESPPVATVSPATPIESSGTKGAG